MGNDEASRAELARLQNQLQAMIAFNQVVRVSRDLTAVYRAVSTQLIHAVRFDSLTIGIYNPERQIIRYEYGWDEGEIDDDVAERPIDQAKLSARVIRERSVVRIDDVRADAHAPSLQTFGQTSKLSRSWMGVPLLSGDRVYGVMIVLSYTPAAFSEADAELASLVASQIAVAVENAQLVKRLQNTIIELSAPLMPIAEGVIVLPLIGRIDAQRAGRIVEQTLETVVQRQAKIVLIDITGVPSIDPFVIGQLVKIIRAVSLLGAECALVGASPAVAQAVAELDIDLLAGTQMFRDLQRALATVTQRL